MRSISAKLLPQMLGNMFDESHHTANRPSATVQMVNCCL